MTPRQLTWGGWALLGGGLAVVQAASGSPETDLGPLRLTTASSSVGRFERIEFRIAGLPDYLDPFDPDEVDLRLRVIGPAGGMLEVPAFWAQDYERAGVDGRDWFYPRGAPGWRARFAPSATGSFRAVAVLRDKRGERESAAVVFECRASDRKGFLRVSRSDPRFLEHSTGEPFFAIGQNLAFIGSQQYVSLTKAEAIFAQLSAHGANYLRIWTCAEDWALAIEARKSAWGRSWSWNPPFAPDPDDASRQCVALDGARTRVELNPSHPVALKPGVRYAITGRVRSGGGASVQIEALGEQLPAVRSAGDLWQGLRREFTSGDQVHWLGPMRISREGSGAAWVDALSLTEAGGGPELLWEAAVNRPPRGFYNPLDCYLLDQLLDAAERHEVRLQLCLLTRDLYRGDLKDPESAAYREAIADACRFLRYAVARWGASTSVAAWEYWNEMDPGLPTDRFYTEVGAYLETIDPWRHLRTTSAWGPSPKDCRHPKLDLADAHFYLRPTDRDRLGDEVEAVFDRTDWLRDCQLVPKPAHLGEFGLADDRWRLRDEMRRRPGLADAHNALWASALSGASGTALFWWWERLDAENVYPLYRPLSEFVADIPWTSGMIAKLKVASADDRVRTAGLRAGQEAWLWVFHRMAAWEPTVVRDQVPHTLTDLRLELPDFTDGVWDLRWVNPATGASTREEEARAAGSALSVRVPPFARDIACRIRQRR